MCYLTGFQKTFTACGVLSAVVALSCAGHFNGGYGGEGYGGLYPGSYAHEDYYGPPQPYGFGYVSQDLEGTHGHMQTSDGRTVRGHYEIRLADGNMRRVEYHADENGFHAKVITNELGTESKDPADVIFQSSALTGEQAALQYNGGSRSFYGGGYHGGYHSERTRYNNWQTLLK